MASKRSANDDVKVTVEEPYQVCFEGIVYMPGDQVTVPAVVADEWKAAGWVS